MIDPHPEGIEMERARTLAGFALSAALLAFALPAPSSGPRLCEHPIESEAFERHTVEVRCDAPQSRADDIRGPARRLFGLSIDLNCAGPRTLESLEGIGAVRAQRIVDERERAPFERVDDLLRVRGIGPRTLEALRPLVVAHPRGEKSGSVDSAGCRSKGEREVRLSSGGQT